MPRLDLRIYSQELTEEDLRQGFLFIASDAKAMEVEMAMLDLIKSGELGFYLSPRLMKKLKAFASKKPNEIGGQDSIDIDAMLFFSWLDEGGSMGPALGWEIESLPNNGSIYRTLLKGGHDEESSHDSQGQ